MAAIANTIWLWLSDEENWERFSAEHIEIIERAIAIDNKGVVLERNYTTYFVDILRMTQTNACTGRRRPILRVQRGSTWLAQEASAAEWEPFSSEEKQQLERAFFGGDEMLILQRGRETHYVDFTKWTLADLSTGTIRHMKVPNDITSSPDPAEPGSSRRRSTSPKKLRAAVKREVMTRNPKAVAPQFRPQRSTNTNVTDCSQCTDTTSFEDYESSISSHEISLAGRRASAYWRWINDSESWSKFDDETAAQIERSWECGAPEMMFEHASTHYFVDLVNFTQTNVDTGTTRAIERVERRQR